MKKEKNNKPVGVKEIAKLANVSIATVDRVLHNRTGVSKSTYLKIMEIIKNSDYKPNILARRLASRKVDTFGVLIPKVSHETVFWQAPLNGIYRAESELNSYGIKIEKFLFDLNNKDSFSQQVDLILKKKLAGLVLAPSFYEESSKFVKVLHDRNIPYIFIDSYIPDHNNLSYIGPELFKSGFLAASLVGYFLNKINKILIINIAKEIELQQHKTRTEEGFRSYFQDNNASVDILKLDITETSYNAVEKALTNVFKDNSKISSIFVTNSRVFSVAKFIEKAGLKDILLVGFDFTEENVKYLKSGIIKFLICQRPEKQGYNAIMALYRHLILNITVDNKYYMPIDIVTKENYEFYSN